MADQLNVPTELHAPRDVGDGCCFCQISVRWTSERYLSTAEVQVTIDSFPLPYVPLQKRDE